MVRAKDFFCHLQFYLPYLTCYGSPVAPKPFRNRTKCSNCRKFPFAYPCRDMTSKSVINCFNQLFSIFGMPDYIHNNRATDFLSAETCTYLRSKGIATSRTSRYNPRCNGQVEKLNGTLWKAIQVTLHSQNMKNSKWETVLPDALHSIRSLLCTATNSTPHEKMFNFT